MKAAMLEQQNKNSKFSPAIMVEIVSLVNNSMQIPVCLAKALKWIFLAKKHRSLEKMPQSITNRFELLENPGIASQAPINTSHSKIRTY